MRSGLDKAQERLVGEKLAHRGLRMTPQRQQVYRVLAEKRDHPTADEVFLRVKRRMPEISLATVYNCLDVLVQAGVARQISVDRSASRYCPNMGDHCHFVCDRCGNVFDIGVNGEKPGSWVRVPQGFRARRFDLSIRGLCPDCFRQEKL